MDTGEKPVCRPDAATTINTLKVPVAIDPARKNLTMGGVYLLLVRIDKEQVIRPGSLGDVKISRGCYVYVGSGLNNLEARLARHKRKRKKLHWHIDYLTSIASTVSTFPIRTKNRLECELAEAVARLSGKSVPGFGSSDCTCSSHLFFFAENPENDESFIDIVFEFRLKDSRTQLTPFQ